MKIPDFAVVNQYAGAWFEVFPLNPRANRWLKNHEPKESGWLGNGALRVFPKYAGWFLGEIRSDGFVVFHGPPSEAPKREVSPERKAQLMGYLEKARATRKVKE